MVEDFELFWAREFSGIDTSSQPRALIEAWKSVAKKSYVAGYFQAGDDFRKIEKERNNGN